MQFAPRLSANRMYRLCAIALLDGCLASLETNVEKWEPETIERGRSRVSELVQCRDSCWLFMPIGHDGQLRLCPIDSHWYIRSNKRMVKALHQSVNREQDAREVINAVLWVVEDARGDMPRESANVDERLAWAELCDALQSMLTEYDPDLTHVEFVERGAAAGTALRNAILCK